MTEERTPSSNVQCCMCGKKDLSTEEGDGGTECELTDGRWVCSAECWDRAVEPTPAPNVAVAAREFMSATEALLNWMNGNELAADHRRQRPDDFERLCSAMVSLRAILATAAEGKP